MRKLLSILMLMAILLPASAQKKPEKYTELYYQRASLFAELPVDSTDIVFLGNSLTHGCEWHELFGMPNIKNRGINGDIVEGIRLRIDPILKGQPAKLFLLCGVNDVSHDLTADSIAGAIGNLIDIIRTESPRTKVYVQSLLPINNSFGRYKAVFGKEQVIRDINTLIEPMVKEKGCTWINSHPAFVDADGNLDARYTNDGLHLMGNGYLHWREILRPYVME
ncbi:MAG: sialate O-acetylesterase [Barnesiella sp.]|nr:sialate O-acetylesterase [Barnesiella sp.]MBD5249003.1 sialate O-acetylesterase [Barnesiella sp.]MDE6081144.1 sialate O-acetylesterase [Muribaculaceae bacterium]